MNKRRLKALFGLLTTPSLYEDATSQSSIFFS